MKSPPKLDVQFFPPFMGFPKEGLDFLKKLKKNNTREWFQPRKEEYESLLKFPMQCLIQTLKEKLQSEYPEYEMNPMKAIFRIYRDTRFSKDKTPYKTNIAAGFSPGGKKQSDELPHLYFHIEPDQVFVGGGVYMPSSDQLKAYRKSIIENPDEFLGMIEDKKFKKNFGGLQGEKLVTAPKGIAKDHPLIEHLKHKQFFISKEFDSDLCLKPKFADEVAKTFMEMKPLMNWLLLAS